LFEEILCVPYRPNPFAPEDFYKTKRFARASLLRSFPLCLSELIAFSTILNDFPLEDFPEYAALFQRTCEAAKRHYSTLPTLTDATVLEIHLPATTLQDLLQPLSQFVEAQNGVNSLPGDLFALIGGVCGCQRVGVDHKDFCEALDDLLGVFLVLMEERFYRGNVCSAIWVQPCDKGVLWVPIERDAKKKTTWWPCLVLASKANEFAIHPDVLRRNIERLPTHIVRELLRNRPRGIENNANLAAKIMTLLKLDADEEKQKQKLSQSTTESVDGAVSNKLDMSSAETWAAPLGRTTLHREMSVALAETILEGAAGHMIVEFLGDHDFGWVKYGNHRLMNGVYVPGQFPNSDKVCSAEITKEADVVHLVLEKHRRCRGQALEREQMDLTSLPTVNELIASTDTSTALALYARAKRKREENASTIVNTTTTSSSNGKKVNRNEPTTVEYEEIKQLPSFSKLRPQDLIFDDTNYFTTDNSTTSNPTHFLCSRCPLPPSIVSVPPGAVLPSGVRSWEALARRRRALVRTKALINQLQRVRPMVLRDSAGHYQGQRNDMTSSATKGKGNKGSKAINSTPMHGSSTSPASAIISPTIVSATKTTIEETPARLGKRKYEFKSRLSSSSTNSAAEDVYIYEEPSSSSTSSHRTLEAGCTRYLAGEGLVYTRKVDFSAPLFFRESVKPERRKKFLQLELDHINRSLQSMQTPSNSSVSSSRPPPSAYTSTSSANNTASQLPGKVGLIAQFQQNGSINSSTSMVKRMLGASSSATTSSTNSSSASKALPRAVSDMLPF
jgi:hypothetical protein